MSLYAETATAPVVICGPAGGSISTLVLVSLGAIERARVSAGGPGGVPQTVVWVIMVPSLLRWDDGRKAARRSG